MKLNGEERRNKIIEILSQSKDAISGSKLAEMLNVSRQVIVTDVALLRSKNSNLISTNSGYILNESSQKESVFPKRIFKVYHTDAQIEEELSSITDLGGIILDVFIQHKVYGTINAPLNISNRRDIQNFINDLKSGVSTPLKNITNNFHYHTVSAKTEIILDEIEAKLREKGFLLETKENALIYEAKNYSLV